MPNYCVNELLITGELSFRRDFEEIARSETRVLDFNNFVPYPEEWREGDEKWEEWWATSNAMDSIDREVFSQEHPQPKHYYSDVGYNWCISNWGSKWNSLESCSDNNSKRLIYKFDTAWSPPREVILVISKLFPDLRFRLRYWEAGIGFKGVYECEKGEVIFESEDSYRGNKGG